MAQQASCLAPKVFRTTLNTVRSALGGFLHKPLKNSRDITFESLARNHGLSDEAIPWMEEVDKTVRRSGQLEAKGFDPDGAGVRCLVFYWTCIALHVRSPNFPNIASSDPIRKDPFCEERSSDVRA